MPPGEASKSFASFERVCEAMIAARIERGDVVIALGGGVVGDLAGFAASVVRRGIDFMQVPTTLLAQVDSSVGGKTAIDRATARIWSARSTSRSWSSPTPRCSIRCRAREFRAGYAEVAKYGLLGDADFFDWLETNSAGHFRGGTDAREHAIATSCRMKAEIVARDERETGERALLNLGHTFGHAFEAAAGFSDRLLHGEAIAIGMALRLRVFRAARPHAHRRCRPRHAASCDASPADDESAIRGGAPDLATLMDLIAQDKKVKRGKLTFILSARHRRRIRRARCRPGDVRAFLGEKLDSNIRNQPSERARPLIVFAASVCWSPSCSPAARLR